MGEKLITYKCSMENPEGNRHVGRRRPIWGDNNKMY
jgi:hypothetical protein